MLNALLLAAILTAPTPAVAPVLQGEATIAANDDFVIVADHPGDDGTIEYQLYQDKLLVQTKPVSALLNGSVAFDRPGLAPGVYTYVVQAIYLLGGKLVTYSSGTLTVTAQVVTPTGKFKVGDWVQVYDGTTSGAGIAVRSNPSMASLPFLGVHPAKTKGVVTEGPVSADGHFWVKVNYENTDIDGWGTESNLVISTPPPPTKPTATVVVTSKPSECEVTVSSEPPAAGYTKVQFKIDSSNFGTADATAPYTRTVKKPVGTYTFTGVWTGSGKEAITAAPNVNSVCK